MVISASTHGLTGGLFEYRNLGTVTLKGFAENVSAWQVLDVGTAETAWLIAVHAVVGLVIIGLLNAIVGFVTRPHVEPTPTPSIPPPPPQT